MKQTRLYNMILPIWLMFVFPQVWLIALPGNLIIDCVVVFLTLMVLKHTAKWTVLKQVWWKVWLLGFAADFVGIALLIPALLIDTVLTGTWFEWWSTHIGPVLYNCWKSPLPFLWTAAAVALSGVCIYFFDEWALRSCPQLSARERHILALTLAIATAPWTFFFPVF